MSTILSLKRKTVVYTLSLIAPYCFVALEIYRLHIDYSIVSIILSSVHIDFVTGNVSISAFPSKG